MTDEPALEYNETMDATLCTAADMGGVYEECLVKTDVTIMGCHGYLIYKFAGLRGNGAICSQRKHKI